MEGLDFNSLVPVAAMAIGAVLALGWKWLKDRAAASTETWDDELIKKIEEIVQKNMNGNSSDVN